MTRGERAAVRFVRGLIPSRALSVISGFASPEYERVLAACCRDLQLPASDRLLAVKRLTEAFPQDGRHELTQLLMEALDAQFNRHRVRERAAFHVGVAVGRNQVAAARRKAGAR